MFATIIAEVGKEYKRDASKYLCTESKDGECRLRNQTTGFSFVAHDLAEDENGNVNWSKMTQGRYER